MADKRKHIVVSEDIKELFDAVKSVHGQYLSTEGFVFNLLEGYTSFHCPKCKEKLKAKTHVCKEDTND